MGFIVKNGSSHQFVNKDVVKDWSSFVIVFLKVIQMCENSMYE